MSGQNAGLKEVSTEQEIFNVWCDFFGKSNWYPSGTYVEYLPKQREVLTLEAQGGKTTPYLLAPNIGVERPVHLSEL